MMTGLSRSLARAAVAAAAMLATQAASAHFIWITVEPAPAPGGKATVRTFLNEEPEPGGPEFLKFVKGLKPTAAGQELAVTDGEEALEAAWAGALPASIEAERDLGVRTKGDTSYRIYYTARAQSGPVAQDAPEKSALLRTRLITRDGKALAQVLFDGKPVPDARIKIYPADEEARDATADADGLIEVPGLAEGKAGIWANTVEVKDGESGGKPYSETRYYATLTVVPRAEPAEKAADADPAAAAKPATAFATMPAPAVNSFGGAVLGDWLYVYSGHVGRTHKYSTETTSHHFRRLNLSDRATWEDLPMTSDLQGVALVSDGRYVYRLGGMSARNAPGTPHDLHSVAEFSRFDPETGTWTDLAPLPTPRSTHDAAVVGRKIYAVGGWIMKGGTEESDYCDNAAVFDLDHPEAGWKAIEQPFFRRALAAAEHGGKLYVLGGLTDDFKVEAKVDIYDPATDTWSDGPEIPIRGKQDGFAASAFSVGGTLYLSGATGVISRLNPEGTAWEAVGAWAEPRITHRLLPGPGHSLLAVGGNHKGQQTPLIEAVTFPPATETSTAAR